MNKWLLLFLLMAVLVLLNCKKEKPTPEQPSKPSEPSAPSISAVTPLQGKQGDTIIISGKNFSDVITKNKLTMRGIEASIIEATATSLKVVVPDMVFNGQVKVTVNGKEAVGPDFVFLILPKIESLIPATGQQGDTITIMGSHFGADTSANKVTMNGVDAKIVSANASTLRVLVPDMQIPGNVQVKTTVGLSNATLFSFFIPPAPVISSISPLTITQGDTITIHGANFNLTIAGNTLTINGSKTAIVKADQSNLQYVFENPALHGNISFNFQLMTNGGTATNSRNFKIYDVYIVGIDLYDSGISSAKYWKNGQQVILSDKNTSSEARSIAISNGDIYVGGSYIQQDPLLPPGFNRNIAQYWKNGIAHGLITDTASYVNNVSNRGQVGFHGIAVSNGNVHMVYTENFLNGQYNPHLKYWKNGSVATLVGNGIDDIFGGDGIFVSDNDVYILTRSGYLKNGIYYPLDSGYGQPSAVYVSTNTVYISGYTKSGKSVFWKNGIIADLPNGAVSRCIFVSENDVYIGGYNGTPAVYWKNGVEYKMTNSFGAINDIKMIDGNLYMCGTEGGSAKYWKNGVEKTLSAGTGAQQTFAIEIFLY